MTPFSNKDPKEIIKLAFDYTLLLNPGETISSAVWVVLSNGFETENPNMLSDTIDITQDPLVIQEISFGEHGVDYLHQCVATTSEGRVLVLASCQKVYTGVDVPCAVD